MSSQEVDSLCSQHPLDERTVTNDPSKSEEENSAAKLASESGKVNADSTDDINSGSDATASINGLSLSLPTNLPPCQATTKSTAELPPPPSSLSNERPSQSKRVYKVIVLGDSNVGKTCLTYRFCQGKFPQKTDATVGVDFREKTVQVGSELVKVKPISYLDMK